MDSYALTTKNELLENMPAACGYCSQLGVKAAGVVWLWKQHVSIHHSGSAFVTQLCFTTTGA